MKDLIAILILCLSFGLVPFSRSQPLTFNTLAGNAGQGAADGNNSNARFNLPGGVAVDKNGNVYVADTANHTIRKISGGVVSTLAGLAGVSGSVDGNGSAARFREPQGVAVDTNGIVYVADTGNHTIRKIAVDGTVSTLAGSAGNPGALNATGTNALFYEPEGVAVNGNGSLIYVADTWNHIIRKITSAGVVTTLAGSPGVIGTGSLLYQPQGIAVGSDGNIYVGDTGNGTIRVITPGGSVTTLAGSPGNYGGTNGTGSAAQFYQPMGVAVAANGTVYVADNLNHTIRAVTPGGAVTTVAGLAGNYGSADGSGSNARFYAPQAVAVSGNTVYVADTGNGTIRQISSGGAVTTLAGAASIGSANGTGNQATFYWPKGTAVDDSGTVFVSDTFNHTIRKITPAGVVSTFAGTAGSFGANDGPGGSARFYAPHGIAIDAGGNIYVADTANNIIRKVTSNGTVSTLAGNPGVEGQGDGASIIAQFSRPEAVALDDASNIYVADTGNHTIRKISPSGVVTTVAGFPGHPGNLDSNMDNNGTNIARFCSPAGVAVDGSGNVYVADTGNHTIRKITSAGVVSTVAGLPGVWGSADGINRDARFFQPQGITVDNQGNLFVMDSGNHTMRMLTPSGTDWIVSTVAGQPDVGGIADGTGDSARFFYPGGLGVNDSGVFVVVDSGNNTIRTAAPVPARFDQISVLANGSLQLSMSGSANAFYTLLSTTDWTNWDVLAVLPSGNGVFQYIDSSTITNHTRFYRLRLGP